MTKQALTHLSSEECWTLLEKQTVGRLAVAIANRPDVFPVNYKVHDGHIVVQTAEGQKLAAAVLGTAVAFEVDTLDRQQEAVGASSSKVKPLNPVVSRTISKPRTLTLIPGQQATKSGSS